MASLPRVSERMPLARVHGPDDVRLDEVPVPACNAGEVIVRTHACGICGSDLSYIRQGGLGGVEPLREPLAIGHEFAGTIVAVGEGVEGLECGTKVAVNPDHAYIGGGGAEGAMAPFVKVTGAKPGYTVFPFADDLPFAEAALAEPLSVALHALRIAGVASTDKVAVLGAGPIGLCAVVMLRFLGVSDIAVCDPVPERLARARALGASATIEAGRESLRDALGAQHGAGERFGAANVGTDAFIDCAGSAAALEEVVAMAKYRARIAVVALHHQPMALNLWQIMANEISLFGAIADARASEFGEALDYLSTARPDLSALISHQFEFDQFHDAIATARDAGQAAKVILTFGDAA
jgi:L-iditol 2-dehydrogenase